MALFSFEFSLPEDAANEGAPMSPQQVVTLQHGTETVIIPANDAAGKTVADLFSRHASALGIDNARRISFMVAGRTAQPDEVVTAGLSYRATVTSESKGA